MRYALSYLLCILMILLSASLFPSCSEVDLPSAGLAVDYPVTLMTSSPDSKISHEGTKMTWDEDDILHLTAVADDKTIGESSVAFYSYLDENDKSGASFSGFVTMTSHPDYCCFVYPKHSFSTLDPETRKLVLNYATQTGAHEPVMYVTADYSKSGINQTLVHVGAMLELDVRIDDVAQITFVGNSLEQLSPVSVDAEGNVTVGSESGANLQITVPVQSEGKTYIAVPPVNFPKGFSLICSNQDASESMIKTFSTDGKLSSGYDFSAGVGQIIPVTLTGDLENYSITASGLNVEHTKVNNLLTGTSVTFKMNKTGASDKVIEEWGAKLIKKRNTLDPDSKDIVVRTVSYTNETPINPENVIEMTKTDGWPILPAGDYTFAPYYKIYGQTIALDSQDIKVTDPGITLEIGGQTSYDKYKDGNIDGANDHANTLIEGVKVSTNVDLSIINEIAATLGGNDMVPTKITSGEYVVASYGNLTRAAFASYPMQVTMKVGEITVTDENTFHLTGLPYEADFTTGNPTGWTPAWGMISTSYKDNRVVYTGSSGIRSPQFYIPETSITVSTSCSCGHNVVTNSRTATMNISVCSSNASSFTSGISLAFNKTYYTSGWSSGFKQVGYLKCENNFILTNVSPCLMYNMSLANSFLGSDTFVSFKHMIEYSK